MGKSYAVILAAGKGKRMNAKINKQFLQLNGKPVLYHTINAFSKCNDIDGIVLVSAKEEIDYCKVEVVEKYNLTKVLSIVEGGEERQDSVLNGLEALEGKDCSIVLIHDGARPFVSEDIISKGIESATEYGASACGVQPKDTIKVIGENNFSKDTLDRNTLISIQTPQCFNYELILNCHRKLKKEDISVTDDTMVAERYGHRVYLYNGSYDNIKLTTPEDMVIGGSILLKEK